MKHNKLMSWMAVGALVLTAASCQDNLGVETPQADIIPADAYGNGSKLVTINVTPDSYVGTRAISDGKQATSLYFEVYEVTGETTEINSSTPVLASVVPTSTSTTGTPIPVSNYKATIKLAVDKDKSYRIALWAQKDSESGYDSPFSFTDKPLTVTVDYSKVKNNTDAMDAFCATEYFNGSATDVNIILHRPFAQLNVGTTGADYDNFSSETGNIYPHRTIKYSQVVVSGVYDQIDVANDKIKLSNNANSPKEIKFSYNKTIAEQTSSSEEYLTVKLNPGNIKKEILKTIEWFTGESSNNNNKVTLVGDEEDLVFFPFKTDYPTLIDASKYRDTEPKRTVNVTYGQSEPVSVEEGTFYLTEEFKYLSMCYVLVPNGGEHQDWFKEDQWNNKYDKYSSCTLPQVDVYFGENETDGYKYFTVYNVPVHRNWRTNLLGGLADTTPNDPDDPSSLFANVEINVNLCPIYFGEYNGQYYPDDENGNFWQGAGQGSGTVIFPTGGSDNRHEEDRSTQAAGGE